LPEEANHPGKSLLPLLSGQNTDWDNMKFGEYGDMRMVRVPEYKLVKRYPDGPDELFDLKEDPEEEINCISLPGNAAVKEKLEEELDIYFNRYSNPVKSGLNVKKLPRHNAPQKPSQKISSEGWRDGIREIRGMQIY
jgi:arylsulfatase A-like enzyme